MSMFCQQCGNELASQYRFCPACGGKDFAATRPGSIRVDPQPPGGSKGVSPPAPGAAYAGFWRRFAAYFIDALVLMVPQFIIGGVIGAVLGGLSEGALFVIGNLVGLMIAWIYFAHMESSSRQGTLGKRAMGLRVYDMNRQRISFGHATGRFFGKLLSAFLLGIGYLMVAFTERKQGLHDKMAGTVVLHQAE